MRRTLRFTGRWLLRPVGLLLLALLLLFGAVWLLIRIPAVQTALARQATTFLESKLHTPVIIGQVDVALPDMAVFRDIRVYDQQNLPFIRIGELRIDLLSYSVLVSKLGLDQLNVRSLSLRDPVFYMHRGGGRPWNHRFMIQAFASKEPTPPSTGPGPRISLPSVLITNGTFIYQDSNSAKVNLTFVRPQMNYVNLRFEQIAVEAGLEIDRNGDLRLDLCHLAGTAPGTGFTLDHAETVLKTGAVRDAKALGVLNRLRAIASGSRPKPEQPFVSFEAIQLQAGGSELNGYVFFPAATLDQVFLGGLTMPYSGGVVDSKLDFATLNPFLSSDIPLKVPAYFSGKLQGDYCAIFSPDLNVTWGRQSRLVAEATVTGIDGSMEPEFAIKLKDSRIVPADLLAMLPEVGLPSSFAADTIAIPLYRGSFDGIADSFYTTVFLGNDSTGFDFTTHMILPPLRPDYVYDATWVSRGLNPAVWGLGDLIPAKMLNGRGTAKGVGFEPETMHTSLSATITRSELAGFPFDSLRTDSITFHHGLIAGKVFARDGESTANLDLSMNVATSPGQYTAKGKVSKWDLQKLGIYDKPFTLSTLVDANFSGDSLEQLIGGVKLRNTMLVNQTTHEVLTVADLAVDADTVRGDRLLTLNSSLATANIRGKYTFGRSLSLIDDMIEETSLYFANVDTTTREWYATKAKRAVDPIHGTYLPAPLDARLELETHQGLNDIFTFLQTPLYLSPGATVTGDFSFHSFEQATVSFQAHRVTYDGIKFRGVHADVDLNKSALQNELLLVSDIQVDSLYPSKGFLMEDTQVDFQTLTPRTNELTLTTKQLKDGNRLQIKLLSEFLDGFKVKTHIDETVSRLYMKQLPGTSATDPTAYEWTFSKENSVLYDNGSFQVDSMVLSATGKNQALALYGWVGEGNLDVLQVKLRGIELGLVNEFVPDLGYDLDGRVNLAIHAGALLGDPRFTVDGSVHQFRLDAFEYGNIQVASEWQNAEKRLMLNAQLHKDRDTLLNLTGYYDTDEKKSPLNFQLGTQSLLPLDYITPFVDSMLYDIHGLVALKAFDITGSFDELRVKGKGFIHDAGFGVDYFKTEYTFDSEFDFDFDRITFKEMFLYDKFGNKAKFYGTIHHKGLKDFVFDLQMDQISNFLFMDTRKQDNPDFYGKVVVKDGIASVTGNLSKLTVDTYMVTGAGTALKIPLSYTEDNSLPPFIRFAGPEAANQPISAGTEDFELNLTINATPDAEVELIFDDRVGDIIRGSGNGTINMQIDAAGNFSMFGDYEITKGDYLFTAMSLVNKKFDVKPGGRITWSGDPYDAQVKIDAVYSIRADIKELLPNETRSVRVPTDVLMHMEGSLMQPRIDLSIALPNLNEGQAADIALQIKQFQYDQQELNKQVFSLMVFNRFSKPGGFTSEGLVSTSVSELLTNQFNYWLSQALNDKVNVAFSNSGTNVNALISAKLFNDRVTIERDGTIVAGAGQQQSTLGNISMMIKLLPTENSQPRAGGRPPEVVIEVFNREVRANAAQQNVYRTGAGIVYKKDFDTVYEFLGIVRRR